MRIINILTHPLSIPVYTYALFVEMERQSYVLNAAQLLMALMLVIFMVLGHMLISDINKGKTDSSLSLPESSKTKKTISVAILSTAFILTTLTALFYVPFYTWGAYLVFAIFILPSLLMLSGKTLLSAGNCGAMSGFTIVIGYKTSTDTFWPFVISLFIFTITVYLNTGKNNTSFSNQAIAYAAGILQAIFIMFIFA